MATKREKIIAKAIEVINRSPDGVRYSDLVREMQETFPEFPVNTIHGSLWDFKTHLPKEIYQPARGVYRNVAFRKEGGAEKQGEVLPSEVEKIKEENFYEPFANWLVNELEECTKAIALGGNKFKDKWGTPDVIGKRESRRSDIVKAPTEIISAEIKADTTGLITAFGQACAYKLFSHKTYIVVPKNSSQDDISKLDALCLIFGIGLVLFDNSDVNDPKFEIRVRPIRHEPDMFYVNHYMKMVEKDLFGE